MRNRNFFLLLLVLISCYNATSQNFDVGDKWYYGFRRETSCEYEYDLYEITRDTLIQGKTCFILEVSFHDQWDSFSVNPNKEIIYEEGSKVYIFKNDKFHVLYDFNAKEGDTITVMDDSFYGFFGLYDDYAPYQLFQYVVNSVDTLSVNDMYFKRFIVSGTDSSDWTFDQGTEILENIGRYSGDFFGNVFGFPKKLNSVFYGFCNLRCFNDISFVDYPCNNVGQVSSIETNQKVSDVFFYPSVISDKIFFTKDNENVNVYNIFGQKITEINPAIKGEYSMNHLRQGIYILEIENYFEKRIFKIIKR